MTSGATFTVLFNRAMLLMPRLISSCYTRFERTSKSNGTRSPFANMFIHRKIGCHGIGCPDLSSHLSSGSLS